MAAAEQIGRALWVSSSKGFYFIFSTKKNVVGQFIVEYKLIGSRNIWKEDIGIVRDVQSEVGLSSFGKQKTEFY